MTFSIENCITPEGKLKAATHPTIATDGTFSLQLPFTALTNARARQQGRRRAHLHTASAEDTGGIGQRHVKGRGNVAIETTIGIINGIGANNFVANTNATGTEDTAVVVDNELLMAGIHW